MSWIERNAPLSVLGFPFEEDKWDLPVVLCRIDEGKWVFPKCARRGRRPRPLRPICRSLDCAD